MVLQTSLRRSGWPSTNGGVNTSGADEVGLDENRRESDSTEARSMVDKDGYLEWRLNDRDNSPSDEDGK